MLILCFLANTAGLVGIYYYQKHNIRADFRAFLRSGKDFSQIETLTLSKSEMNSKRFKWIESFEFMLDGRMYDIVSKSETSDSITFKCVNDIKEEQLKEVFRNESSRAQSDFNALKNTLLSIQKTLQQDLIKVLPQIVFISIATHLPNNNHQPLLHGYYLSIFHPPSF